MRTIEINRAPVLTLWAAVVAERLGFERAEALTLGRGVAGRNAARKAEHLGLSGGRKPREGRRAGGVEHVELLGISIPVHQTPQGLRAGHDGKPDSPEAVERYLEARFGDALEPARKAMVDLAGRHSPEELGARAFSLYEAFRPEIPRGTRGWGAKGVLDLSRLAALARTRKSAR